MTAMGVIRKLDGAHYVCNLAVVSAMSLVVLSFRRCLVRRILVKRYVDTFFRIINLRYPDVVREFLAFHKVLGEILGRWVFCVDVTRGPFLPLPLQYWVIY